MSAEESSSDSHALKFRSRLEPGSNLVPSGTLNSFSDGGDSFKISSLYLPASSHFCFKIGSSDLIISFNYRTTAEASGSAGCDELHCIEMMLAPKRGPSPTTVRAFLPT